MKAALGRIFLCGAVAAQAELEDHLRSVLSVDLAERTLPCLEGQLDDMRKALATLQNDALAACQKLQRERDVLAVQRADAQDQAEAERRRLASATSAEAARHRFEKQRLVSVGGSMQTIIKVRLFLSSSLPPFLPSPLPLFLPSSLPPFLSSSSLSV